MQTAVGPKGARTFVHCPWFAHVLVNRPGLWEGGGGWGVRWSPWAGSDGGSQGDPSRFPFSSPCRFCVLGVEQQGEPPGPG